MSNYTLKFQNGLQMEDQKTTNTTKTFLNVNFINQTPILFLRKK